MLVQFRAPDLPPSGVPIKRKEGRVDDPDPDSLPLQTRNFRLLIVGIPVVVKRELSIGPIQALQSSAKTYDP